MSVLRDMAQPFPAEYVEEVDKGGYKASYINHAIVTQRALSIVGHYDIAGVQLIRGVIPEHIGKQKTWPAREGVVGALVTIRFPSDNGEREITEVGSVDIPAMQNDAENAKDAVSDALKRCWMRAGLGLEMWVRNPAHYFLHKQLEKVEE